MAIPSTGSARRAWLAFGLVLLACLGAVGAIRVLRAERSHPSTPTQRDLQLRDGLPVETAPVVRTHIETSLRLFGIVRGTRQAEVVSAVPNVLERLHVAVGDRVAAGQVVASMREVPLTPLGFQLEPLAAQDRTLQAELARIQTLHAQGAVTDSELDRLRAQAEATRAQKRAAEAAVHVVSPIAGTVTRIDFQPGDMVPNDRPLLQVADLTTVGVDLLVEAGDVAALAEAMPVTVTTAALPGRSFPGTVTERSLGALPGLGQYRVRVQVPNPDLALLPGFPAEVTARGGSGVPRLVVPRRALVTGDGSSAVWVVGPGDRAVRKTVVPQETDGVRVAVDGDLREGDRVVTLGAADVQVEGQPLLLIQPG
ncbi:MAG: efflux RND transporter periplasmic adaptor subunit [Deltaproteobacteria bacterium]|nr:efflux RND transporter periplasmic adaptor subunit [Deltaproteobacteria bacterium]